MGGDCLETQKPSVVCDDSDYTRTLNMDLRGQKMTKNVVLDGLVGGGYTCRVYFTNTSYRHILFL